MGAQSVPPARAHMKKRAEARSLTIWRQVPSAFLALLLALLAHSGVLDSDAARLLIAHSATVARIANAGRVLIARRAFLELARHAKRPFCNPPPVIQWLFNACPERLWDGPRPRCRVANS
jgi:hypothetical protein